MTVVVSDVVDACTHFFGGTCTLLFRSLNLTIFCAASPDQPRRDTRR